MNKDLPSLNRLFLFLLFGFFFLVVSSLFFSIRNAKQTAIQYAKNEANGSYAKDLLYRRWAAMHGGIYVPITDTTPPNPYLGFIKDRDVITTSGKKLTLMNPAYMTRQVFSIADSQNGVKGHITSLNPIRLENKPDPWETEALKHFEKGDKIFSSIEKIGNQEYLRLMHPMFVEKRCLKCHEEQGYKIGDIRGGISVSVPMTDYNKTLHKDILTIIVSYLAIFIFILAIGIVVYRKYKNNTLKRQIIQEKVIENEANLRIQNKEYYALNEEYKSQNEELIAAKLLAEKNEKKLRVQKKEIELNNERLESLLRITQISVNTNKELFDFALSEAINLTQSKIGYIYFYNEATEQFTLNSWSKDVMERCSIVNPQTVYNLDTTGCWGDVVRLRKAVILNDYNEENSQKKGIPEGHVLLNKFLSIPVIFEEKIVAVVGVANKESDYDNADIRQLTLLMDNVWKISERLWLIENLQTVTNSTKILNNELKTINRIISACNSILNTSELLAKILDEALEIVQLEGGTICMVESDNTLKLVTQREASVETINELNGKKIKVGDCLCGNCALDKQVLILNNKEAILKYCTRETSRGETIQFHAAFPFVSKNKCIGILCVFTRTDKKPLERNLKLIETLTAQVALVLENSILFTQAHEEIKERKLIQEKLLESKKKTEESEQKLKEAQQISHIGNWELDLVKNNLVWSDEIYRIFNCQPQEFKATYEAFLDFIHPEDRDFVNSTYTAHIQDKIVYNIVHRILLKNGSIRYVNERCNTAFDENGKAIRSVGTVADITDRIEIEKELLASKLKAEESDRLKTAFLQNMSHEIRTPMNAIIGFSGLLENQDLTPEKRKSFTSIIQNSSNQLLSIITDILSISAIETKQEKCQITKVNVNNLIVELLAIFKNQATNQNISLYTKKQLTDIQSEIYTDITKITQILTNLVTNALKFTHEGYIEFGYNYENNFLNFYVKDTGIGIAQEYHNKIFERFQQADKSINRLYGGTGLGLAISKAYVELLGGKISVESEPEKGSTFYFTIPYNPVYKSNISDSIGHNNVLQKNILIAEDEEYNFLFLEEILNDKKFNLLHAKNGKETIDLFQRNPEICIILMDIKMPILNGHEAAELIKKINPKIPIIAQSAYALEQEKALYESVFDDYITKPINKDELIKKIDKYLI